MTVEEYLAGLPADRRAALEGVRGLILENLDPEFEEGMQHGTIGYYVPHRIYPAGYHVNPAQPLPFLALASQKQNMALYLMHLYVGAAEDEWFRSAWEKSGKKLDMGKSCLRFRKLDDLALDVLAAALRRVSARAYIEQYEQQRAASGRSRATRSSKLATKAARDVGSARKVPSKKRGSARRS